MDKGGLYESTTADEAAASGKKIQCVYCWSRHTLTDM